MTGATASLQEFCRIVQGGRHRLSGSDFVPEGYPAYGAGGMNGFLSTYEFDEPAVILSAIGARCGKCFYTDGKWTSLANTQLILPDRDRADPRFLWYQLNDERRWHRSGTGQPFIKPSDVKSHRVFLPPLPEQQRIAEFLDRADALRVKRRATLAQLDILTQSIFLDMFGDPVTNPKGWPQEPRLGDVADIVSGVTKGRKLNGQKTREVPYLAVINVQDRALNLSTLKSIEATEAEIARYRLLKDDLLLTEGGDPDKLGRGTLWNDELPECIHQNHIFRVRLKTNALHPLFLNWLVGSERGKSYFLRSAKQTTGIASINMTQLRGFPLLVPPIELQRSFAARTANVNRLKSRIAASLGEVESLFRSLQHAAFKAI